MSKGSKRRPGKPGAYEEGYERIFGKPNRSHWSSLTEGSPKVKPVSDKQWQEIKALISEGNHPHS